MLSRPPLVVSGLLLSVSAVSALLTLAAPENACDKPDVLTRNTYRTPIAAAVEATWLGFMSTRPAHVALNLPLSVPIDTAALRGDIGLWRGRLVLYRDSSLFARAIISTSTLKQLRGVYDVRPVADSDFFKLVESDFPQNPPGESPLIFGAIYRVSYEACRGWPCHDLDYVEVRRVPNGYVGCRMLMMGTE